MSSAITTAPKSSKLRKGLLTFLTIGAVGAVGAFASTAVLTDDVAAIEAAAAHGGTLTIDEAQANVFQITGIENMVPYAGSLATGGWKTSSITVKNNGSLPGTAKMTVTGSDANGCFEYYIGEHNPINGIHGIHGNAWNGKSPADTKVVELGTMAPGGTKGYTFGLRMKNGCTVGSGLNSGGSTLLANRHVGHAQAGLTVKFDTTQEAQA